MHILLRFPVFLYCYFFSVFFVLFLLLIFKVGIPKIFTSNQVMSCVKGRCCTTENEIRELSPPVGRFAATGILNRTMDELSRDEPSWSLRNFRRHGDRVTRLPFTIARDNSSVLHRSPQLWLHYLRRSAVICCVLFETLPHKKERSKVCGT